MSNYLSSDEEAFIIEPRPLAGFVETPYIKELTQRALNYINAGFPVHLRGVSGTGKTTLAKALYEELIRYKPRLVLLDGEELRKMFPAFGYDAVGRVDMGRTKRAIVALLAGKGCDLIVTGVTWKWETGVRIPGYFPVHLDIPIAECKRRVGFRR